jgi:hypothetical protein
LVPAAVTPIVQGNVVIEPVVNSLVPIAVKAIVGSSMIQINEEDEPVFRNILPIMRTKNSLLYMMCHLMNLLEDLRVPKGQLSLKITRFMLAKKFKCRVIPPLLKKP